MKRRNDQWARFDRAAQAILGGAIAPFSRLHRLIPRDGALVHGVRQQHDRTRLLDGLDQRRIGLLRGERLVADFRSERPVGLEKREIDRDDLRWSAIQIIDEGRIDNARPRPPPDVRR